MTNKKKLNTFRFKGLAFRYGFYVISSMFVLFAVAFAYMFSFTYKILLTDSEQNASHITQLTISRIRSVLQPIEDVPLLFAKRLEVAGPKLEPVMKTLKEFIQTNKEVYGSCIAFEPNRYHADRPYYAPYLFEHGDSVVLRDLGDASYNYLEKEWYTTPKLTGKSVWSAPYFDEGGGNMLMCTFSVPFYTNINGERVFTGVITMDISLTTLQEIVDTIHVYKTGFGFLISRSGKIITFPDSTKRNQEIWSVVKSSSLNNADVTHAVKKMLQGESGFVRLESIFGEYPSWMYYAPVTGTEWEFGLVFPSKDLFSSFFDFSYRLVLIFALSVFIMLLVIIWITRRFTKPLTRLAYATREMGKGNLLVKLPVYKGKDEITDLANSFALMQEELQEYLYNLKETTKAKEKIEGEIGIARTIQLGMLPVDFPVRSDFNLAAILQPARGIGGDLYDFVLTENNKLYFAIGDVSGKGVPASLFMAVTRTLFRAGVESGVPLNLLVTKLNNELCKENPNQMFVTFLAGILHLDSGELELCNAGHNPPFLIRKSGEVEKLAQRDGIPLGILEGSLYTFNQLTLQPAELLLTYTDGVTDAIRTDGGMFGEERLISLLLHSKPQNAKGTVDSILLDLSQFSDTQDPFDDVTVFCVQYTNYQSATVAPTIAIDTNAEHCLILSNEVAEIGKVNLWIEKVASENLIPSKIAQSIILAIEELVSNIIFYGYQDTNEHQIVLTAQVKDGFIRIRITDDGIPFNVVEHNSMPNPDISIEEREIGGLGLHLVLKIMDQVEYERINDKNVVTIIKQITE